MAQGYSDTGSMMTSGQGAFVVTKSDSTVIDAKALWIGGAGNVTITTAKGEVVEFTNVPVGIFPMRATKVMNATTATGIVGIY